MTRARHGYTLVEVMAALIILTVGASSIIWTQGASLRSNQDAGESTIAVNFGTTWIERIKRDARLWTTTGNAGLAGTRYLNQVNDDPGVYFLPTPTDLTLESPGADHFGFDTNDPARIRYCVNLRLTVVHAYDPLSGGTLVDSDANALRADLRVWWHRAADANRSSPRCLDRALTETEAQWNRLRKQHLSTVVSWRAPGWP